jgi:hypothetical protein
MHADQSARDSLGCDVMEAVRPLVDEMVLDLVLGRIFKPSHFFETREGICRILPPLSAELVHTGPIWRKAVTRPVEKVALRLVQSVSKKKPEVRHINEKAGSWPEWCGKRKKRILPVDPNTKRRWQAAGRNALWAGISGREWEGSRPGQ